MDLGRKIEQGVKLSAADVSPDKTQYPHTCIYDLRTSEVKGVKVGSILHFEAKVTQLTEGEDGIQSLEVDLLSLDDGKKNKTLKSQSKSDMEAIDKGLDDESKPEAEADDADATTEE